MRKLIALLLPALVCATVVAQSGAKLDLRLWNRLQHGEVRNATMGLLVQGDPLRIKILTEQYGGIYKYSFNNISSVEIPEQHLLKFSDDPAVVKIQANSKGVFLMDTARIKNNIDSVQGGFAPLQQAYKGTGVVVGVIDGGIYWQHGDFRNPLDSTTTRIRYIWDQTVSTALPPAPYNYGSQWSWLDINNGTCTHSVPTSDNGHGTCVAGIAAGNSLSTRGTVHENELTGVAPEAEIIAVRVDENDAAFLNHVVDAATYIYKKASALGKPCVINTSIGTYYGSHDGRDLTTYALEHLLDETNGRALVAAAGNGGANKHHLGYTIPADSAFTLFKYNTTYNEVYFDFWADTANFRQALFAIGANDTFGTNLGRTAYINVPTNFKLGSITDTIINRVLYNGPTLLGQITLHGELDEDRYHIEVLVNTSNKSLLWRLQTSGSGKFDLWSSSALIGSADFVDSISTGGAQNEHVYISDPSYRHSDYLKTLVSSWQCSDKVITVGNYSNRAGYFDRDSIYVNLTVYPYYEVVGKRFATSSFGPTRDERMKPDVMATGSTTITVGEPSFIAVNGNKSKVYVTRKHIRNGGTSMASPVVAGIAALYLQKRPTATYQEIKQALICTAVSDSFTGATPNFEYGNGKVNAFKALSVGLNCIVFGATDTACINYNPLAQADSGTCVAKVYGCTDTAADNYNANANVNDGSCTFTGIKQLSDDRLSLRAVPNPFKEQTTFQLQNNGVDFSKGEIKIYSITGALLDIIPVRKEVFVYVYKSNGLQAGIYQYALELDGRKMKTGKLVIQ